MVVACEMLRFGVRKASRGSRRRGGVDSDQVSNGTSRKKSPFYGNRGGRGRGNANPTEGDEKVVSSASVTQKRETTRTR